MTKHLNQFRDTQKTMEPCLVFKGKCFVRMKTTENVIDEKENPKRVNTQSVLGLE